MAKFAEGPMFMELPEDPEFGWTRFAVRGLGSNIYTIHVDNNGLWTCDCRASRFHGICYHVNMWQFEQTRLKKLHSFEKRRCEPSVLSRKEFYRYLKVPRFVLEPRYAGPHAYLYFARHVYLGGKRVPELEEWPEALRYAGTVLEGVWDSGKFRIFDCLFFKGLDYSTQPMAVRRDRAETVVRAVRRGLAMTDYCHDLEDKRGLLEVWKGNVILKDMNGVYANDPSLRRWMSPERTRDGKFKT